MPPLVRAGRRRLCAYLASRPNASNATARRQFSPCARADYGVPLPPPPPPPPPPSPSPPPSPPPPPSPSPPSVAVTEEGEEGEGGERNEGAQSAQRERPPTQAAAISHSILH